MGELEIHPYRQEKRRTHSVDSYQKLAMALLERGRIDEADRKIAQAKKLNADPDLYARWEKRRAEVEVHHPVIRPEDHAAAAESLYAKKAFDRAAAQWNKAIGLAPARAEFFAGLGKTRLMQAGTGGSAEPSQRRGWWRAAQDAFAQAAVLDPHSASYQARLGEALGRLGERAQQVTAWQEAARLGCKEPQVLCLLVEELIEAERYAEAESLAAVESGQRNRNGLLGAVLAARGDYTGALAEWRNLQGCELHHAVMRLAEEQCVRLAEAVQDVAVTEQLYAHGVKLDSTSAACLNGYGRALRHRDPHSEQGQQYLGRAANFGANLDYWRDYAAAAAADSDGTAYYLLGLSLQSAAVHSAVGQILMNSQYAWVPCDNYI